jgi:uncharacterized repeat protein (TIGR04138 family)
MKPTPALPQQDSTYQQLREWISVGRFLPGQRLKIHDLAAQLGTGVMPVRSALQRLSAEGALVNVPHSGVTVPKLSAAEFDDVLQMRLLLEGEAAERGAHRIDEAGLRQRRRAERHVSGQQLCEAARQFGQQQYGFLAKTVLATWGIRSTADIGEIVFNMIDIGQMRKTRSDKREDFHDVFDFHDAFARDLAFAVPDRV